MDIPSSMAIEFCIVTFKYMIVVNGLTKVNGVYLIVQYLKETGLH
jgi:hypothetical protein